MNIKITIAALAVIFAAPGIASATTNDCKARGGGYVCGPNNFYIDGSKVGDVKAASEAYAIAKQQQLQGQAQGQTQSSSVANSVTVEGAPKFTASFGVGVNFDIPIARGIQGASCRENVRLAREMGYENIALQIFLKCPHVRKLNLVVNPGDKG